MMKAFADMRQTYAPLVWQSRSGGIEVPDHLWRCELGINMDETLAPRKSEGEKLRDK